MWFCHKTSPRFHNQSEQLLEGIRMYAVHLSYICVFDIILRDVAQCLTNTQPFQFMRSPFEGLQINPLYNIYFCSL